MMLLRSSTVEPVLGTLLNFRGMKRVYTKGIGLANKHVLIAAAAYNLKKLLAYKTTKSMSDVMANIAESLNKLVLKQILFAYYSFLNFLKLNESIRQHKTEIVTV